VLFKKKQKIKTSPLEAWIADKWTYMSEKCIEKGDILYGQKVVDRLCGSMTISNEELAPHLFFL
jgi:hypothetical protein